MTGGILNRGVYLKWYTGDDEVMGGTVWSLRVNEPSQGPVMMR